MADLKKAQDDYDAFVAYKEARSKHIRVTLDFIPVEERLPDNGRGVFGVQRSTLADASLRAFITEMMYVQNMNSPLEPPSSWWLTNGMKPCWPVTHWAEMPEINGA